MRDLIEEFLNDLLITIGFQILALNYYMSYFQDVLSLQFAYDILKYSIYSVPSMYDTIFIIKAGNDLYVPDVDDVYIDEMNLISSADKMVREDNRYKQLNFSSLQNLKEFISTNRVLSDMIDIALLPVVNFMQMIENTGNSS